MKKRLFSVLLSCALAVGLCPSAARAADTAVPSSNKNGQNYSYNTASVIRSYVYENADGWLTRVEYAQDGVIVEDYDSDFHLMQGRTIPAELSLWGGFFSGKAENYLIFGQENPEEDDSREVIRVVQYSKDWQRLGQASLYGANTILPFSFGSLRCAEYDGMLYVRTCHQMYASSDGRNHQANLTMAVRESDMTCTDSYSRVMNSSVGYVSHSFNQFVLVDADQNLVTLDHGDAYPRSLVVMRYVSAKAGGEKFSGATDCSTVQAFPGAVGDNTTGATAGGFAETSAGYVTAYNYDGIGGGGTRNVYLGFTSKSDFSSAAVQVTDSASGTDTPVLVSFGLDGGFVLWTEKDASDRVYYAAYDAEGRVGETQTMSGMLSDCQPIVAGGKAVWYVTDASVPIFYSLSEAGSQEYLQENTYTVKAAEPEKWDTVHLTRQLFHQETMEKIGMLLPKEVKVTVSNGDAFSAEVQGAWVPDLQNSCWVNSVDAADLPEKVSDPDGVLNSVTVQCSVDDYTGSFSVSPALPTLGESGSFSLWRYMLGTEHAELHQITGGPGAYRDVLRYDTSSPGFEEDEEGYYHYRVSSWQAGDAGDWFGIYYSDSYRFLYIAGTCAVSPKSDAPKTGSVNSDPGSGSSPSPTQNESSPFADVSESDYYYDAVLWAVNHKPQVTVGMGDGTFGSRQTVTRAQAMTFFWRAIGEPEPDSVYNPFTDVHKSDYYYQAVLWAVQNDITVGTTDATFSPDQTCSTAHIITFLYRLLYGGDGWYAVAGDWAEKENLLAGTGVTVTPNENCSRANVVTFLYRAFE